MTTAFEEFCFREVLPVLREADGVTYRSWCTQSAWLAWQAATKRATDKIRDMHAYTGGHGEPTAPSSSDVIAAIEGDAP